MQKQFEHYKYYYNIRNNSRYYWSVLLERWQTGQVQTCLCRWGVWGSWSVYEHPYTLSIWSPKGLEILQGSKKSSRQKDIQKFSSFTQSGEKKFMEL